jgi:hypothetical protein
LTKGGVRGDSHLLSGTMGGWKRIKLEQLLNTFSDIHRLFACMIVALEKVYPG